MKMDTGKTNNKIKNQKTPSNNLQGTALKVIKSKDGIKNLKSCKNLYALNVTLLIFTYE